MDAAPYVKMPSREVRADCFSLLLWKAYKYNVPPAHVTAHIRSVPAVRARRELMLAMLAMGLTRGQVAMAFGRDLRRVRASVIGTPDRSRGLCRVFHDFARFDLFGRRLPAQQPRPEREGGIRRGRRQDARQLALPIQG